MKSKKISSKGTAIWINETGAIRNRIFNIVKQDQERKKVLITFSPKEAYWVPKLNLRGRRIILYEKSNGEILSQNPDAWGKIDLKAKGIKVLRFNLQNSSLQESKASIYRWTTPKDAIDKLGPIFKLLFICIAIGVMGWAALKFGAITLDAITKSRLMECKDILPKIIDPIGAITNSSIPIGATP